MSLVASEVRSRYDQTRAGQSVGGFVFLAVGLLGCSGCRSDVAPFQLVIRRKILCISTNLIDERVGKIDCQGYQGQSCCLVEDKYVYLSLEVTAIESESKKCRLET